MPCTFDAHVLPRLQSLLPKRSVYTSVSIAFLRAQPCPGLLGGRLLFVFLVSSRLGSWLDIESVGSICCVCDMVRESALFRSNRRECRSRSRRALTTLLAADAADHMFQVAPAPVAAPAPFPN